MPAWSPVQAGGDEIGEAGEAIPDRRQRGDPVVLAAQSARGFDQRQSCAGLNQPRPHRIERHVSQRRREMRLVHDDGAKPALPEMAGATAPRMNDAGIAAMHGRQRLARLPLPESGIRILTDVPPETARRDDVIHLRMRGAEA
jgi:hypothetical protein